MIPVDKAHAVFRRPTVSIDLSERAVHGVERIGRRRIATSQCEKEAHDHGGCLEVCFLSRGSQDYRIDNETLRIKGGDLLIVPANSPHGPSAIREKSVLNWLLVDVEKEPLLNLPADEARTLLDGLQAAAGRSIHAGTGFSALWDAVLYAAAGDLSFRQARLRAMLTELLTAVVDLAARPERAALTRPCQVACQYVEEHIAEDISVSDLAESAHVSTSHLHREFKKHLGLTPREYVLRQKIEKATQVLQTTDLTITDVAHALGFSSSQYFATVFRRYTGSSPGEMRQP